MIHEIFCLKNNDDEILTLKSEETKKDKNAIIICTRKRARASAEFSENVIMGPSSSASWPGALLRADTEFVRGNIETIQVPRGPITRQGLYIDLPGMEEYDMPDIHNPSQATVQGAIRRAVDWWLENKYPQGYRNSVRVSSSTSVAHSWPSDHEAVQNAQYTTRVVERAQMGLIAGFSNHEGPCDVSPSSHHSHADFIRSF